MRIGGEYLEIRHSMANYNSFDQEHERIKFHWPVEVHDSLRDEERTVVRSCTKLRWLFKVRCL